MTKLKLHWQILIALVLAGIIGTLTGTDAALFGVTFYSVFGFLGTIFLNALKMLIVPLIASSIIVGVAGIGSGGNLGRLGGRTMMFYILSTSLAIIVGLVLVNMVKPGLVDGQPAAGLMALSADVSEVAATVGDKGTGDLAGIFIRMVPANIVKAAAEGEMLGLIFFCLLFGYFMSQLPQKYADTMFSFWDSMFQVMMRITHWVMNFAPYGVFGLVAKVVAETGFDAARPLLVFTVTVIAALAIHALITLPLLVRFIGRVNPWKLIRAVSPALLTAFSTSSSSATLPITIDSVEKNVGVSNRVSSFVLPLGATVNMDGTALYECMAALFIAQAYGVALTISQQVVVVVTALLTSIGVAGIPSASLVAIAIILTAVGLPIEAIGLLFVFDRILDMMRTSINVFGDTSCAVVVARLEGETEGLLAPEKT
ncbi:MAG: dicarboxylate/amino acid:cation symporter [Gammaproteobacteria bacterium]|nr:dicarboxylate/amino acid:cation symporter [Gammaproteobacteria bacterium]